MSKPWSHHETHKHCGCCGRCSTAGHYVVGGGDFCADCIKHLSPAVVDGTHIEPWNRTYFAQHHEDCPLTEAVDA